MAMVHEYYQIWAPQLDYVLALQINNMFMPSIMTYSMFVLRYQKVQ